MLGALIGAAASIGSGLLGASSAKKAAAKQAKLQKEFAQNGIQWKVADAKKAGIHPLYALGAQTSSYSPVSVGDGGLSSSLSSAGQDIGRAIDATRSSTDRAGAIDTTMRQLQLEGLSLDNDIKRADVASKLQTIRQAGSGPSMPTDLSVPTFMDGQTKDFKPSNRIAVSQPGMPETEAGLTGDRKFYRTITGWSPEKPSELAESHEGEPWPGPSAMQWYARNKILPTFYDSYFKPPFPAPPGQYWTWNAVLSEYQLNKGGLQGMRERGRSTWSW